MPMVGVRSFGRGEIRFDAFQRGMDERLQRRCVQSSVGAGDDQVHVAFERIHFLYDVVVADPAWGTINFWVPIFFVETLHFSLKEIAMFVWLPFLLGVVCQRSSTLFASTRRRWRCISSSSARPGCLFWRMMLTLSTAGRSLGYFLLGLTGEKKTQQRNAQMNLIEQYCAADDKQQASQETQRI